jgi:hypothetical protein
MQEVQARFRPMHAHAELLAVPFSDHFDADIAHALQQSGLPDRSRLLHLAAVPQGFGQHGARQGGAEAIAAACLVERTGAAFGCCAWLYAAVIERGAD